MGAGLSLPEEELEELLEATNFKKQDLKRWYKRFMKDYPDGKIIKEQFNEIYGKIYTNSLSNHLTEYIFNTFDRNNDGYISFKELMLTLSVTANGSEREKLEWAFGVYDLDGNGTITMDEISHVITCMENVSNTEGWSESGFSGTAVEDVFKLVDNDANGSLSLEEFIEGMQAHPTFSTMLTTAPTPKRLEKAPRRLCSRSIDEGKSKCKSSWRCRFTCSKKDHYRQSLP